MAVLEIRTFPDPALRERAREVARVDEDMRALIGDMAETMYAARGVGLAAPQVGVGWRVIVVDVSQVEEGAPGLMGLVNPGIIEAEGERSCEEGCLSLPDYTTQVTRAERIRVRALSAEGEPLEFEASGFLATALQHEMDHLDGTLILDKGSFLSREFYKKKLRKRRLAGAGT